MRLDWSVVYRLAANYGISLRLLDAQDQAVSTFDTQPGYGYLPTGMWRPGELVTDQYELLLPEDVPPGDGYRLLVILYQVQSGKPVGQARLGGFSLPLERAFEMQQAPRSFELPGFAAVPGGYPRQSGAMFGEQVRLAGYELVQDAAELCLTLWWQALQTPAGDYTVFVHLFDPLTEAVMAQSDAEPRRGTYPTAWWSSGEVVSETVCLALADAPAGTYRIAIGLYDRMMTRLPAHDADGQPVPDGRVVLPESVDIEP